MKHASEVTTFLLAISVILTSGAQSAQASSKNEKDAQMKGSAMKGSERMKGSETMAAKKEGMDTDMAAMMEKWQKYASPNENHKILDQLVGNWKYTVEWKMAPEGESQKSTGESEVEWIMGDRFVQHKAIGNPEAGMEQPYEGIGYIGYDNVKNQYISFWIDNMGTGMMKATGSYDQTAKALSEAGDHSCPMTGDKRNYRAITTFVDDNNYTYETYTNDENGNEFRSMLITYSRKKS